MEVTGKTLEEMAIFGGELAFAGSSTWAGPTSAAGTTCWSASTTSWTAGDSGTPTAASRSPSRVAQMVGVRHCIATGNGTVALEIATRALGLKGEVVVPSSTLIATAHALQRREITPSHHRAFQTWADSRRVENAGIMP